MRKSLQSSGGILRSLKRKMDRCLAFSAGGIAVGCAVAWGYGGDARYIIGCVIGWKQCTAVGVAPMVKTEAVLAISEQLNS